MSNAQSLAVTCCRYIATHQTGRPCGRVADGPETTHTRMRHFFTIHDSICPMRFGRRPPRTQARPNVPAGGYCRPGAALWGTGGMAGLATASTAHMRHHANACDAEPSHCSQLAARARQRPPLLRGDAVRHAGHGHSRIRHLRSKAVTWCEIAWVNCVRTYGSSPRLRASAH